MLRKNDSECAGYSNFGANDDQEVVHSLEWLGVRQVHDDELQNVTPDGAVSRRDRSGRG